MESYSHGSSSSPDFTLKRVVIWTVVIFSTLFLLTGTMGAALKCVWAGIKAVWSFILWVYHGYSWIFPLLATVAWLVDDTTAVLRSLVDGQQKALDTAAKDIKALTNDTEKESAIVRRLITQLKAMDDRLRKLEPVPIETQETVSDAVKQFTEVQW